MTEGNGIKPDIEVKHDTLANIDWNKNNFVTYVITVGPQPILFTATAVEWDPEQIGYYNVQ